MASGDDKLTKAIGLGQVLLGLSFAVKGLVNMKAGARDIPGELAEPPAKSALPPASNGGIWWMNAKPRVIQKTSLHSVRNIEERVGYIKKLINDGSLNPAVREKAIEILTRKCGDRWCLPTGTLVLKDDHRLLPIESIRVGDRIAGEDGWTEVTGAWDSGRKPLLRFILNNGSILRCSEDHRLLVVQRRSQNGKRVQKGHNGLPGLRSDVVEKQARDVVAGDELLQPASLPFGEGHWNEDEALVSGAYVADGWVEPSRFSIAGLRNGKGVREKVEAALARLKWSYSSDKFKVRVKDAHLASVFKDNFGALAPSKHLPTIGLDEATIRALLEGLNADARMSRPEAPTFSTTSYQLALQYRMLYRMLGQSASMRMVTPRTGNQHAIYQVNVRADTRGRGSRVWARVKRVEPDGVGQTFDLETKSRRIYLPESDVVVHNCVQEKNYLGEVSALFWAVRDPASPDAIRYLRDHVKVDQFTAADKTLKLHAEDCDGGTITLGAMLMAVGYPVKMRVVGQRGAGTYTHIYLLAGIPPGNPTRWVPLDWSVETASPGWEVPGAREMALSGRPAGLIDRLRDFDV